MAADAHTRHGPVIAGDVPPGRDGGYPLWDGNYPGSSGFLPGPTIVPCQQIARTLRHAPPRARILDVGAGGRRITPTVVTLDAVPAPGVDLVGDIHRMPVADGSFDCVVCTGTLSVSAILGGRSGRSSRAEARWSGPDRLPFIHGYPADPTRLLANHAGRPEAALPVLRWLDLRHPHRPELRATSGSPANGASAWFR